MKKKTLLEVATLSTNLYFIMKDIALAKKVMYITAGLALASKQKMEAMVREFIDKSEMSEEEGKKLLEEITAKASETREAFEEKMEAMVKKALDRMHIATSDEIRDLRDRIAKLEAGQSATH